jgi:hypothetical protein
MMNVLQLQERLKDYSQQQLAQEMKMPSGQVPQYLVLGEMQRRKRMQAEQAAAQSQQSQTTVAEDAVAAAGVPQEGIAGMAQAMAPRTDMAQNTGQAPMPQAPMPQAPMPQAPAPVPQMAGGGIVKYMQTGGLTEISPQASTFAPTLGRATKVDGLDVLLLPDGNVVDARTRQPVSPAISQKARGKLRPPSGGEVFDPTTPTLSQVSSGDIGMNEAQLLDEEMRQAALEGGVNPSYDYSQMMQDLYGIGISDRMPSAVDVRDRGEISPLSAPDAPRQPPTLASVGVDKLASADRSSALGLVPSSGSAVRRDTRSITPKVVPDPADVSPGSVVRRDTRLPPVPRAIADEDKVMSMDVEATPLTPEQLEKVLKLNPDDPDGPDGPDGPDNPDDPTTPPNGGKISAAALSDAERGFNQDKWLALAKFGFTLMSSTLPVGMALGQAGSAGVAALQAARKTYEDAKLAQQTLAARRSGRSKLLPAAALSVFDDELESIEYELSTGPTPDRKVELTNRQKELIDQIGALRSIYFSQYFGGRPSRGQQTSGPGATDVRD